MTEWTVSTVKEYFDALMLANTKAVEAALASADRAVNKADEANNKRLDGLNELRAMATDQTKNFLPRTEYQAQHDGLMSQLDDLKTRVTKAEGRSGLSTPLLSVAAALAGALVTYVLAHH